MVVYQVLFALNLAEFPQNVYDFVTTFINTVKSAATFFLN